MFMTHPAHIEQFDVIIVGSRLAGCAAAVPLARAGRRVLVLDKSSFPSDQLSTHMMAPNAVAELQTMGALREVLELNPALSREAALVVQDGPDDFEIFERWAEVDGIDYCLVVPRI